MDTDSPVKRVPAAHREKDRKIPPIGACVFELEQWQLQGIIWKWLYEQLDEPKPKWLCVQARYTIEPDVMGNPRCSAEVYAWDETGESVPE